MHNASQNDEDMDGHISPRGGLLETSAPPTHGPPSCLDVLDGWIAASPNLLSYVVLINSALLIILLVVCLVMYHRVQQTLDKVDSIANLNPFPH